MKTVFSTIDTGICPFLSSPTSVAATRLLPVAWVKAEYGAYYKKTPLYLSCVEIVKAFTTEGKLNRTHDLNIAAFLRGKMQSNLTSTPTSESDWIEGFSSPSTEETSVN